MPSDVLITPASSKIDFTDGSNATKRLNISGTAFSFNSNLNVLSSTSLSSAFKAEGINGTLFEITDDLSNSLMSVNTIGGLPVFEVFANNSIIAGQYNANDFVILGNKIGLGYASPVNKLSVSGAVSIGASYNVAAPSNGLIVQGDVGIGVTSFAYSNANRANLEMYGSTDSLIGLRNSSGNAYIQKYINDLYINNVTNGALAFSNNGSERWRITSTGIFESNGAQTIRTSIDSLTLATNAGNGHIILSPHGTGNVGIGTASPVSKFVVNGGTVNTTTYTASEARIADGSLHLMKTVAGGIFESIRAMNADVTAGTTVRFLAASTSDPFNNANGGKVFIDAIRTSTNMDLAFSLNDVAGAAPVERVRFMGNGNVGIGTNSPSQLLHISSATTAKLKITADTDNADENDIGGIEISQDGGITASYFGFDNANHLVLGVNSTTGPNIYLGTRTDGTSFVSSNDAKVTILNGGSVGIGTTNPTNKLHVYSSDNELVFIRGTTAGAWINVQSGTSNLWSIGADGVNGFSVYNRNSNSYALIVRNDGNLGIGNITTASNKLHVNGSASIGSNYNTAAPTNGLIVEGSVAIGATTASDKLTVVNGNISLSDSYKLYNGSAADSAGLYFSSNQVNISGYSGIIFRSSTTNIAGQTERMRITNNGNVGIGITVPSATLHLNSTTSGATLLRADGTNGTLFSVIDDLSDSLMSVNNSAGLPVLEVFADDRVVAGQYGANDFVLVNNKLGLGTNNPQYELDIVGPGTNAAVNIITRIRSSASSDTFNTGSVIAFTNTTTNVNAYSYIGSRIDLGGAGDNAQALIFATNATNTLPTEKMRIKSDGNVGIGITSPLGKVHIYGFLRVGGAANEQTGTIALGNDANPVGTYGDNGIFRGGIGSIGSGNYTNISSYQGIVFNVQAAGFGSQATRMLIDINGNVGIGTASPTQKLDIVGSYAAAGDSSGILKIRGGNTGADTQLNFGVSADGGYGWIQTTDVGLSNDRNIILGPLGGNVGIGTTTPAYKLDVNGTIGLSGRAFAYSFGNYTGIQEPSGGVAIYLGNATDQGNYYDNSTHYFRNRGGSSNYAVINSSGNLGVGTTTAYTRTHVYGTLTVDAAGATVNSFTEGIRLGAASNGYSIVTFGVNAGASSGQITNQWWIGKHGGDNSFNFNSQGGGDVFRILQNGNVGIGNTTPGYKLYVNGNGYFNSTLQVNSNITLSGGGDVLIYDSDGTGFFASYMDSGVGYIRIDDGGSANGTLNINSGTLFVGPSSGNVGIGVTSPTAKLQVGTNSSAALSDNSVNARIGSSNAGGRAYNLTLANTAAAQVSNDSSMSFIVAGNYSATSVISAVLRSTVTAATDLVFTNYNNALFERMRIKFDGNIGIGTSGPDTLLQVGAGSPTASGSGIQFGDDTGTRLYRSASGIVTCSGTIAATFSGNLTGNATNVTGTVALANGGSGQTSAQAAMNAFAGAVTSGSYLRGNGTNVVMSAIQAADVPTLNQNTTGNANTASLATTSDRLTTRDNRTISPSEDDAYRLRFGFTSWANNDSSPYADYLHLRSYSDSSGGNDNLVMFRKDAIGMRIYQAGFGTSVAYSSFKDVAFTDQSFFIGTTSVAINRASAALTLSGVNISGTAASETFGTVTGRGSSTSTQISVGTTAGGSMYTGIKSGAGYSDAVSGATFKSITDHPTGGSFAFAAYYNGAPGTGTNSFYVAANGGAYFAQGVGIGVTSPLQALHINGNIILDGTTNGYTQSTTRGIGYGSNNGAVSVDGFSGMDIQSVNAPAPYNGNYSQNLRFWTHHFNTGSGATPRMFLQYNGNLGIGTLSPTAKLNILSTSSLSSVLKTEGVNGTLFEVTDDLSNSLMSVNTIGGLPVFEVFANNSIIAGQYGQNDFVISGNKVGIGTASPIYKLDVYGSSSADVARFYNNSASCNFYIGSTNNTTATALVLYTSNGNGQIFKNRSSTAWGGADSFNIYSSNGAIAFHPAGTTNAVYFATNGNVGINTITPAYKLDVNGTSAFRDTVNIGPSIGTITWGNFGGGTGFGVRAESGRALSFGANGSFDHLVINTAGNVGIGTVSPGHILDVRGDVRIGNGSSSEQDIRFVSLNGDWQVGTNNGGNGTNNNQFYFYDSAYRLTIQSGTGNVGIGTVSPSSKFVVNNNGGTGSAFYVDVGNINGVTTLFEHTGNTTPVPFRLKKSGFSGTASNYGLLYLHMNDGTVGNGSNLYFTANDSAGNEHEYGGLGAHIITNTNGAESGDLVFYTSDAGTIRSEKVRIKFNGNVGIGTTAPAALLQIGTGTPTAVTGGIQFGGDTSARLYRSSSGVVSVSNSFAAASGYVYASNYLQTGNNLIYPASFSATQRLEVGNTAQNAWITGISIAPGGNVVVAGTLTESSSIRYKENIQTISAPILPKLNEIRPVTYNKKDNPNNIEYGIIAEELNDLFPELVNKNNNGEVESVNYSRLTVLLIKAVKELKQEIEILKNK